MTDRITRSCPPGIDPAKVVVHLEGWGPFTVPAEARASELMLRWPAAYFPAGERVWWRGNDVLWHPDEGWNGDDTEQADPVITFRDGDHIILAPKGHF